MAGWVSAFRKSWDFGRTVYSPRNVTKPAPQYTSYAGDLNACRLMNGPEFCFGGSRRSSVRFVTASAARRMNAMMRIVHGNPTRSMRLRAAMGKMVPPALAPSAMNPSARPLRRLNQCAMTPYTGPKMTPQASWMARWRGQQNGRDTHCGVSRWHSHRRRSPGIAEIASTLYIPLRGTSPRRGTPRRRRRGF